MNELFQLPKFDAVSYVSMFIVRMCFSILIPFIIYFHEALIDNRKTRLNVSSIQIHSIIIIFLIYTHNLTKLVKNKIIKAIQRNYCIGWASVLKVVK